MAIHELRNVIGMEAVRLEVRLGRFCQKRTSMVPDLNDRLWRIADDRIKRLECHLTALPFSKRDQPDRSTNPTLKIIDIEASCSAAKAVGAISVVDNTFATPVNQLPLSLGADLVVHSATKFLGGHDDALGGVLAGRSDLVRMVFAYREITGAVLSPFNAYLLLRGLKTLDLRVRRQNETAMSIARMLSEHPAVTSVFYPGLESHAGHSIAVRQMSGFGGIVSFSVRGGFEAVKAVLERLQLVHRAASLGSVNTLAGPLATTSHVECTAEQRLSLGIPETLIRYSCGIEDAEDLKADLLQALEAV